MCWDYRHEPPELNLNSLTRLVPGRQMGHFTKTLPGVNLIQVLDMLKLVESHEIKGHQLSLLSQLGSFRVLLGDVRV